MYADIDITNTLAAGNEGPDIMKISYAALPWVHADYALIPCGGALGRGCGPLVLTGSALGDIAANPAALAGKRVAVPSERSTAYLLFRLWAAQNVPGGVSEIVIMPFHEIMPAVRDGLIDAGLVIHEARFTYQNFGLTMLTDLGAWWETDTGLPIPLGAIVARKSLDHTAIAKWIRSSVEYAWAHPEASQDYVIEHSQELAPEVVQAHIDLYVNEYSADLGESGFAAVHTLLARAIQEELIPPTDLSAVYDSSKRV
ncbi:unnamed protein product [Aphanomyces euteiches]